MKKLQCLLVLISCQLAFATDFSGKYVGTLTVQQSDEAASYQCNFDIADYNQTVGISATYHHSSWPAGDMMREFTTGEKKEPLLKFPTSFGEIVVRLSTDTKLVGIVYKNSKPVGTYLGDKVF